MNNINKNEKLSYRIIKTYLKVEEVLHRRNYFYDMV